MTDIGDQLQDDHRNIIAQIAAWADAPNGDDARARFLAIIDHLTVHACFVDLAVAPLVAPLAGLKGSLPSCLCQLHHSVMALLDRLRWAVEEGQVWITHLGILTEVVCPHLVLRDQLLLAILSNTMPASRWAALGRIFRQVKDEHLLAVSRRHGRQQETQTATAVPRRSGHYPAHHPEPARRARTPGGAAVGQAWRK